MCYLQNKLFSFSLPTPLEIPVYLYFPLTFFNQLLKPCSFLEFPLTFLGVGMDILQNCTITKSCFCQAYAKTVIRVSVFGRNTNGYYRQAKKEHIRNVKTCANGSNIAKHAWSFGHRIDFDNSCVIDKGSFRNKITLEAWHTSVPSMLTIILRRFKTSKVFVFKNSHLINTFTLLLFFILFSSRLICIYVFIVHSIFYPSKAVDRKPKAHVFLLTFSSQRTFLL